jgi:tRNA threonylcarbamoyladenosine biosynthesis protein TsaB
MAAAKGFCYALNLPLIAVNTLQIMAIASNDGVNAVCPMIDARRMEVFTAIYDENGKELMAPSNRVLDESSFAEWLQRRKLIFCGNGRIKFEKLVSHPNALYSSVDASALHMAKLSYRKNTHKEYCDLAYCEPYYGKEFYSPAAQSFIKKT